MLNGMYDYFYPYEASQKPFFEILGSEEKDHKLFKEVHHVPVGQGIQETLGWFDRHLGKPTSE